MQREREKTIIKDLFIKKSQKYYKNKRNNSNVDPQMRSYFLDILIILIFLILFIILIIFIILIVFINLIILITLIILIILHNFNLLEIRKASLTKQLQTNRC